MSCCSSKFVVIKQCSVLKLQTRFSNLLLSTWEILTTSYNYDDLIYFGVAQIRNWRSGEYGRLHCFQMFISVFLFLKTQTCVECLRETSSWNENLWPISRFLWTCYDIFNNIQTSEEVRRPYLSWSFLSQFFNRWFIFMEGFVARCTRMTKD